MTHKRIAYVALMLLLLVGGFGAVVKANPSYFIRDSGPLVACNMGVATTSPTFMTAGTATTTIAFDTGCGGAGSVDSASLLIQMTASSTSTTYNVNFEYSQDSIDWYQDDGFARTNASSTGAFAITTANSLTNVFASSTPGLGAVLGTGNTEFKEVVVRTPTRYVRALITLPAGSTNGAVWGEFVAKRQAAN